MKKLLTLILAGLMIFTLASCAGEPADKGNADETKAETEAEAEKNELEGVEAPADILNAVWNTFDEDHKFLCIGGDIENPVDNAAGAYNIANAENLVAQLVCNADAAAMIDSAASLMHMMNANTFTGAAYHIKDGSDAEAFITTMKTAIQGNQWMCGFPEKLLTAKVTDDYVVVVFGNGDLVEYFKTQLTAQYSFAEVNVDPIG